jgi:deoxyribonuclease (pyrimidine dimer)
MTRINCIPPEELCTKHLVAEYRELPRVFGQAAAACARGEFSTDKRNPTTYVLGTGHVRFFYNKLGYLTIRFEQLVAEMLKRGYKPMHRAVPQRTLDPNWYNNWVPTPEAQAINRARIAARMPK